MKKLYLFLLAFGSSFSFAQTIDQSDLPFAGLGWTSGVDSNYIVVIPAGGTGQSWNFSGLQYDYIDTSGFANAAGTPYAGNFPTANLAAHNSATDEWSYFTNSSTGFYINGFVSNTAPFIISPPQMYIPVPFSYGDMHTNISRVEIDTFIAPFATKIILNFQSDFHADGSGSLITPTGTYPSTLRIKQTILETDSILVDVSMTGNYVYASGRITQTSNYRWYTHGAVANYILGLNADSLGISSTGSDYLMQWAMLGINDLTSSPALKVYPDPATENVTISSSTSPINSFEVYNIIGKKVQHNENISSAQAELKLDVSNWIPGIYFYIIQTGSTTVQGKFSVQH